MARKAIASLALLLALIQPSFSQTAPAKVSKLSNGITLIVKEDHAAPLVGVDVWVRAGSANEAPEINGISHFIEHLGFAATAKRQPGDVDLEMESLGATLDARTAKDWAHFSTTVSSRYFDKALDVLADVVTGAQFREEDIKNERLVILDEIARKNTDPMKVCRDYLSAQIYGSHPYSMPIEGSADSVGKISRQNILDYYNKYYVPQNMAVILVGDINPETAAAEAQKTFGALTGKPAPQTERKAPAVTGPTFKKYIAPFKLSYLGVGFLGPAASDSGQVCATDLLLTYLGFGYHSWMADELKDRMKLAEDATADFLTQREPGMISIVAAAKPENLDKAKEAVLQEIARVQQNGISEAALAMAKRSLLGQFAFQNETYGGQAGSYGFYFASSDAGFADRYIGCVQSVTNADVIKAAREFLNPDKAAVVIMSPATEGAK